MGNIFRTRRNGWTPEMETAQVPVGNTVDGTEGLAKAVRSNVLQCVVDIGT